MKIKTEKIKNQQNNNIEEKLVINSISDLLKIPISKINSSKIENFTGIYFDKIYKEVIENENPSKENEFKNNQKNIEVNENIIHPKLLNKDKEMNINNIREQIIKKEYDDNIPPNNNIKDYRYLKDDEKINNNDLEQKEDETQDNEFDTEKNDFNINSKPKQNLKRKNSKIPINKILFSINYNSNYGEEVAILGSLSKLGFWQLSGALPLHWNNGNIWTGEINIDDEDWQKFEFKFIVVERGKIKKWENGENNVIDFDGLIKNIESNKIGRYNKYKYEYNNNEELLLIKCYWH